MADPNDEILNIDGGNSSGQGSEIDGGNSQYPLSPQPSGATGGFVTAYANIALQKKDLKRIDATFRRFNDQSKVKFIKEYYSPVCIYCARLGYIPSCWFGRKICDV